MQYTNHPHECDELLDSICKDYTFVAADYPTAWTFREFLKKITPCDFSEIEEDIYPRHPDLTFVRVIFFTCRPKDMERLAFIAKHFHWLRDWEWKIIGSEGEEYYYGKEFRGSTDQEN